MHQGLDGDSLTFGVDPKFLDTTFTEFNITKGSASVPDVAGILDKAMGDKNQLQDLSPSVDGWLNLGMTLSSILASLEVSKPNQTRVQNLQFVHC